MGGRGSPKGLAPHRREAGEAGAAGAAGEALKDSLRIAGRQRRQGKKGSRSIFNSLIHLR